MTPLTRMLAHIVLPALLLGLGCVSAQAESCRVTANEMVNTATAELLQDVIKKDPELAKLDERTLVLEAGKKLITAERSDFKARGWMMLLWYGGKPGGEIVANSAETLETEEDRAHLYFVMGLFQLGSPKQETATAGRTLLGQVKDTGKVTFVPDDMWKLLIETCDLPK
jgi:hypothetical protein